MLINYNSLIRSGFLLICSQITTLACLRPAYPRVYNMLIAIALALVSGFDEGVDQDFGKLGGGGPANS